MKLTKHYCSQKSIQFKVLINLDHFDSSSFYKFYQRGTLLALYYLQLSCRLVNLTVVLFLVLKDAVKNNLENLLTFVFAVIHKPVYFEQALYLQNSLKYINSFLFVLLLLQDVVIDAYQYGGYPLLFLCVLVINGLIMLIIHM